MLKRILIVVASTVLLLAVPAARLYRSGFRGFGPSNFEVIEKFRPDFLPIRKTLLAIADQLIAAPMLEMAIVSESIEPKVIYDGNDASRTNVVMLAATDFIPLETEQSTISFSDSYTFSMLEDNRDFSPALAWTGDNNPLLPSEQKKDGSRMEARLNLAKETQYVLMGLIHREVEFGETESPQGLKGQVYLIRLSTGEVLAKIPFSGPPIVLLQEYPWRELGIAAVEACEDALGDQIQITNTFY